MAEQATAGTGGHAPGEWVAVYPEGRWTAIPDARAAPTGAVAYWSAAAVAGRMKELAASQSERESTLEAQLHDARRSRLFRTIALVGLWGATLGGAFWAHDWILWSTMPDPAQPGIEAKLQAQKTTHSGALLQRALERERARAAKAGVPAAEPAASASD